MTSEMVPQAVHHRQPWYKILYIQVLIAIVLGVMIGWLKPGLGKELKPLGDGFIALIKMMIAPVIFCTVVHGIASMGDLKRVGRVGLKALIYFEVVSTVALAVGLIVGEVLQPGAGFNIDPATIDPKIGRRPTSTKAKEEGIVAHLMASSPTASSARSPAAICCRCCWSRSCPASPSPSWARSASRSPHAIDQARQDVLRHHPHDRARGADRRLRRDGVHGRRLRPRLAVEPGRADRRPSISPASCSCWSCSARSRACRASRSSASSPTSRTSS